MIAAFTSYPAMKDSRLGWLGKVPEHWELRRTKNLLMPRVEKGHPNEPLLAATQTKGVVRKERYENRTVLPMKDLHLLKLVRAGDFVISLRSFQGGIEHAREQGIISPAYTVLYPAQPAHHGYFAQLFKSAPYVQNLSLFVTGIRQGQNIDYERLARSRLPLPPVVEQQAIVRFLDHADRRIQRYIRAKERLIELLEEQKQAIIHQAVTGQIDVRTGQPYPSYRDSGVEWLGEVPEHWEVVALKWVLKRLVDCEHKTAPAVDESSYRVVRTTAVRGGSIRWDGTYCTSKEGFRDWTRRAEPASGDVIFTREAPVGEACVVPEGTQVCLGQRTVLMRPIRREYDPDFLVHMIYAGPPRDHVRLATQGTTVGHFNMEDIGALKVLKPPYSEQRELVSEIGRQKRDLDLAVSRTELQVGLLREYRTRLISDVVTGKLDVREAAASLPEIDPLDGNRGPRESDVNTSVGPQAAGPALSLPHP